MLAGRGALADDADAVGAAQAGGATGVGVRDAGGEHLLTGCAADRLTGGAQERVTALAGRQEEQAGVGAELAGAEGQAADVRLGERGDVTLERAGQHDDSLDVLQLPPVDVRGGRVDVHVRADDRLDDAAARHPVVVHQPLHGDLEVGVEVDEGAQLLGEPVEGDLLVTATGLELLDPAVREVHGARLPARAGPTAPPRAQGVRVGPLARQRSKAWATRSAAERAASVTLRSTATPCETSTPPR